MSPRSLTRLADGLDLTQTLLDRAVNYLGSWDTRYIDETLARCRDHDPLMAHVVAVTHALAHVDDRVSCPFVTNSGGCLHLWCTQTPGEVQEHVLNFLQGSGIGLAQNLLVNLKVALAIQEANDGNVTCALIPAVTWIADEIMALIPDFLIQFEIYVRQRSLHHTLSEYRDVLLKS